MAVLRFISPPSGTLPRQKGEAKGVFPKGAKRGTLQKVNSTTAQEFGRTLKPVIQP